MINNTSQFDYRFILTGHNCVYVSFVSDTKRRNSSFSFYLGRMSFTLTKPRKIPNIRECAVKRGLEKTLQDFLRMKEEGRPINVSYITEL